MRKIRLTPGQIVIIIAAVIGAIGTIIAALIMTLKVQTVQIYLTDSETKEGITGQVFIDTSKTGIPSYSDKPAVIKLKRSTRYIKAESAGYKPEIIPVADSKDYRTIEMQKIAVGEVPLPLPFSGWYPYKGITISVGPAVNECTLNSNGLLPDGAGIVNANLGTALRGKTVILYFSNTAASTFSEGRMVQVMGDNLVLLPTNALAPSGYLPEMDTPSDRGIEFAIPGDFNGKLELVFYQANLKDLQIRAEYK